jgi:DNA-binding HxlR family transcriptional regulator
MSLLDFPVSMPITADERGACAASEVLRRVGEKWSVLVLALLSRQDYGFNELDRAVQEMSRRILTRTLRTLERDGLVRRAQLPTRVEYSLTDLGRSLLPLVVALGQWAVEHDDVMQDARARFDTALSA